MALRENQLKILVVLSDEKGYGNNELARRIHEDKIRGNISTTLKSMRKLGVIENLGPKGNYGEDSWHIKKDYLIFKCIISKLYYKYYFYIVESGKIGQEYEVLKEHGAWADNRMIEFIGRSNEIYENCKFFSKALNDCQWQSEIHQ